MDQLSPASQSSQSATRAASVEIDSNTVTELSSASTSASSSQTSPIEPQVLLILVGLPGSGKTTFADALVRYSKDPQWEYQGASTDETLGNSPVRRRRRWVRASQDDAVSKRRQEVEAVVQSSLDQGFNVVVDRVDFDRAQRAHFVNIAYALPSRPLVFCLVLPVAHQNLAVRLQQRTYHPTIHDPATAMQVLGQMTSLFRPPRPDDCEGFDRIYTLPESRQADGGQWTAEQVLAVVDDIDREGETDSGPRRDGADFGYRQPWRGGYGGGAYGARGGGYGRGGYGGGGYGQRGTYQGGGGGGWYGGSEVRQGVSHPGGYSGRGKGSYGGPYRSAYDQRSGG